jgi:hypothetical protein
MFGFNTANLFVHTDTQDSSFQSLFTTLKPQSLRFPGGHVGNFYHLKEKGYGYDVDKVKQHRGGFGKRIHKLQAKIDKQRIHHNYVEDYLALLEVCSFKTSLVVNVLSETEKDVLALIAKIQEGGSQIEAIELGNELYNYAYRKMVPSVEDYVIKAKQMASAIKAVYPDIPLLVCAAPIHEEKSFYEAWNKALALEKFYDGYVVHLYPNIREFQERPDYGFLEARDSLINYIDVEFPQQLKAYESCFGGDRKAWVTEWNLAVSEHYGNTTLQMLFTTAFYLKLNSLKSSFPLGGAYFHNLSEKEYIFSLINERWQGEQQLLLEDQVYIPRSSFFAMQAVQNVGVGVEEIAVSQEKIQLFQEGGSVYIVNWSEEFIDLSTIGIAVEGRGMEYRGAKLWAANGISKRTRNSFVFEPKEYEPLLKQQKEGEHLSPFSITLINGKINE